MGIFYKNSMAFVLIVLILSSCGGRSDTVYDGRMATAIARRSSFVPYYGYGYDKSVRDQEKELADRIKTWDNTQQIIPWEDLAASMLRHEMPANELGCVYSDKKKCPGCHTRQVRIYFRQKSNSICDPMEGWVVLCLECRKQVKFETIKQ
jgi:hypothetical protein